MFGKKKKEKKAKSASRVEASNEASSKSTTRAKNCK